MQRRLPAWLIGLAAGMLLGGTARAAIFTWNGSGNASVQSHWLEDGAAATRLPAAGDQIVLDHTSPADMTWNGADNTGDGELSTVVVSWTQTADYTGTVTFTATYPDYQTVFTNFTISGDGVLSNGIWTHRGPQNHEDRRYRLRVDIGGDFSLHSNAAINADARGFAHNFGPGKGSWSPVGGGTYGGRAHWDGRATYGSITEPVDLGSGGGRSDGDLAGGAVYLVVSGASRIDGMIAARSAPSIGTGSGGSIYLRTGTLSGQGRLDASAVWSTGGGGGGCGGSGGRVAVVLTSGNAFGDVVTVAYGASSEAVAVRASAAGTVYRQTASQNTGEGTLMIDNNHLFSRVATRSDASGGFDYSTLSGIVIRGKGNLGITDDDRIDFGTLNLDAAGAATNAARITLYGDANTTFPATFEIEDYTLVSGNGFTHYTGHLVIRPTGAMSHIRNESTAFYRLDLTIDGDLTVDSGGGINLDRCGYGGQGEGPVPGSGSSWSSPFRGASHGGRGCSSGTPYGNTYGSLFAPFHLGAGGTHGNDEERGGGGAAVLIVTGTTTLNGAISARGGSTSRGAAGGSVYLTTGYLSGVGSIDVSGKEDGTTGGGGRMAVILSTGSNFGAVVMTAKGGFNASRASRSAAGTIYLQTADQTAGRGAIIVRNPFETEWHTAMLLPASFPEIESYRGADLRLEEQGRVLLSDDVTVARLWIGADSVLDLDGKTLVLIGTLIVAGKPYKSGTIYTAADFGPQVIDSADPATGRIIIQPRGMLMTFR